MSIYQIDLAVERFIVCVVLFWVLITLMFYIFRSEAVTSTPKLQSQDWNRVRLLLEWLQNKKKVDNIELIVTPLFQLVTQYVFSIFTV